MRISVRRNTYDRNSDIGKAQDGSVMPIVHHVSVLVRSGVVMLDTQMTVEMNMPFLRRAALSAVSPRSGALDVRLTCCSVQCETFAMDGRR